MSVGELWKIYAAHPYMPRLRDQSMLGRGLREQPLLWQQEGFALAQGHDQFAQRYQGPVLPTDTESVVISDNLLIVRPDVAVRQRDAEVSRRRRRGRDTVET